eukprot:SAG31_NODE_5756_length_2342_cov_1.624164_2_plen_163_part_00
MTLGGCPTGSAKATASFEHTKTSYIVHAVGPVYRVNKLKHGFDESDPKALAYMVSLDPLLVAAYRAALRCAAEECSAQEVGFCLLSAGVFRGARALEDVVEIGLRTIVYEMAHAQNCCPNITICAYTTEEQRALGIAARCVSDELARGGDGSDHDLVRSLLR